MANLGSTSNSNEFAVTKLVRNQTARGEIKKCALHFLNRYKSNLAHVLSLPSALGTETPSPLASLPGKGICALASAETQGRLAAATASEPCSSRRNPMELNFEQKWEVERA